MTDLQKLLVLDLIAGRYIVKVGDRYKLYEGNMSPARWLGGKLTPRIDNITKLDGHRLILSKRKVLALRRNDWIKKTYKTLRNGNA